MAGDPSIISPSGPWDPGRDQFTLDDILNGRQNLAGWRQAIDTEDQRLAGSVHATGYQLRSDAKNHDFYALFGIFSHGVSHAGGESYDPTRNWVSVGYYATSMSLSLELQDQAGMIWDSGPTSTVGSDVTSFNVGGNLSGGTFSGEPILQGGASASFGASFASPDVVTGHAQVGSDVHWDIRLPGVGFVSPGNPANPKEPSYAGYKWYFGAIFVLPKGKPFSVRIKPRVEWHFDYTRGITNDKKIWNPLDDGQLLVRLLESRGIRVPEKMSHPTDRTLYFYQAGKDT